MPRQSSGGGSFGGWFSAALALLRLPYSLIRVLAADDPAYRVKQAKAGAEEGNKPSEVLVTDAMHGFDEAARPLALQFFVQLGDVWGGSSSM